VQFISSLFGGEGNSLFTALFALGIVIVLIVLGVWLLRLVFNASGNIARGRNRRLSVVDSLALDPKRQLLIIRRDNVEHLILTGGPQDVLIEAGIAIDDAATQPTRRPVPVAPRRPAPVRPAAPPAPTTAPAALDAPAANRSLRHTGLMRPVPGSEPVVNLSENSELSDHDSAKEEQGHSTGSTELDEQNGDIQRDERKADGV